MTRVKPPPPTTRRRETEKPSDDARVETAAARVVAVGASAGGLDAFIDLLSSIPAKTGLAFVLVQHLDPRHESMLAGILTRTSAIPVQQVTEGVRIERDHVYVIPPDREMTVSDGILRLAPRTFEVPHRPLDNFFRSLAMDQESRAIGVVLSGNDTDGSAGLQAIRDAGGITFAQDPESAKFDVMPRAAASAADLVLPPRDIARQLIRVAQQYGLLATESDATLEAGSEADAFERILDLLRQQYQTDFRLHKQASVQRRILRRVLLGGFPGLESYAVSLAGEAVELENLYQDLLIGVTSFFREPGQHETMKALVFPEIVKNKTSNDTIRIWVPGCSTGEEVYSTVISLLEFLDGQAESPKILIYGTDVNEKALDKARAALYGERTMANVTPVQIKRFFSATSGGYKIAKKVRDLCVFARQDVSRDPPYSRIDLVTCCNVLIYFGLAMQKKALSLIHYALVPDGFLLLGNAESLRTATSLFRSAGTKPLIYRKEITIGRPSAGMDLPTAAPRPATGAPPNQRAAEASVHDRADSFLITHLVPCGVLINDQLEIIRFRGNVADYLALIAGDATLNLFRLIRHREVLAELRPAVRNAVRDGTTVASKEILVTDGVERRLITFEVVPYTAMKAGPDLYWVLFHDHDPRSLRKVKRRHGNPEDAENESEALALRRTLAEVVEDRERLADEAGAAAEEAQSSDEELRSTNEELETAKEELQSANEELSTLNDELRNRNVTLSTMNDDLENLLAAVEIPILFVGVDSRVRRFNTTAGMLLNLDADSIGRLLVEAKSSKIDAAILDGLVNDVIESKNEADIEIAEAGGRWRLARIRPYRTSAGNIDGAIVALVDIDAFKRSVLSAETATTNANMLAEASVLLASSLDYETTLASLTRLSTAEFADWCAVDLVNGDGSIRHLTITHANPVMRDLALQFQTLAFQEPDLAPGAPEALRLRASVLLSDVAEWQASSPRPETKITQLIGALGITSLISVPLIARGNVLGTATFASSRKRYDSVDLQLAEELTRRAATAIDSALLFRDAEGANNYKDAFLGTVAHELRTPLTSILGWVQLAGEAPNMSEDALRHVAESANLLRVFIEDLLDVARIRQQKLRMDMGEVDLGNVVRSAIDITRVSSSLKGITVTSEIRLSPAMVTGDSVRLLQVVWNLLSNAIKFTPKSGSIDIRLDKQEGDVRVSVHDTGIGIRSEFLPHVFELFRQSDETQGRSPGLGIGLAIVSQIVKLHGGTVCAQSDGPDKGSTFTITLPLS